MGSTISSYIISNTGISVYQKALEVTGHNVSNINTEGYTRQQAVEQETKPIKYVKVSVGTGVSTEQVRQIRSAFLDAEYRSENSDLGYQTVRQETLDSIQSMFNDLSDSGLANTLTSFFNSWQELSKDPENLTTRASVVEYGKNLVDSLSSLSDQLDKIQNNLDSQIQSTVDSINDYAEQIKDLNIKAAQSNQRGENANDYLDQRNELLDKLSELVNINAAEKDDGTVDVTIGGISLVSGDCVNKIECVNNDENGEFNTVKWKDLDEKVRVNSGKLLGLIESRGDVEGYTGSRENGSPVESGDQETDVDSDASQYNFDPTSNNIIPEINKGLNNMVSLLARKINTIQNSGVGLDGSTGVDFFVRIDSSLPFSMDNLKVNPELDDANKIAASASGASGDGTNATNIVDLEDKVYFQTDGSKKTASDYYQSVVDWISTAGEKATSFVSNQTTLLDQTDSSRQQISAVSMDEEMSNIIKFQHAYSACTRAFTAVDEMINQIISSMGIVGRG